MNDKDAEKTRKQASKSSKSLLLSVALGIAGSIIIVPLTYLQIIATLSSSYVVALTLGLWVIPCLMPLAVVKRPGSSLIGCCAIGVVSAVATPFGISAIPALLVEGVIVELPFALTLYRKFKAVQYYVGGALLGGFMGFMVPFTLGIQTTDLVLQLSCMSIALVAALVGTWICRFIGVRIRRTGILGGQA